MLTSPALSALRVAVQADSSVTDVGQFLQYGILGLLVVAMLTGWLVPGYLYKQERTENDRLKRVIEERLVGTAAEYAEAMHASSAALDRAIDVIASRAGEPFDRRTPR